MFNFGNKPYAVEPAALKQALLEGGEFSRNNSFFIPWGHDPVLITQRAYSPRLYPR